MPKSNQISPPVQPLFIRRSQLPELLGISISTIRRLEAAGEFPARKKIGPGIVAWDAKEILAWARSRTPVSTDVSN